MNSINLSESESLKRIDQESGQAIIVPPEVRYISDWTEYQTKYLFDYPHILDKKLPGCGYTEFCIRSNLNIILCSPRRILLENKTEQHPGDVFYAKNEMEKTLNVDKDFNKKSVPASATQIKREEIEADLGVITIPENLSDMRKSQYIKLYEDLVDYKQRMQNHGRPLKILVTYDSFHIIKDILGNGIGKFGMTGFGILDTFQVVVDEFQSIFTDAVFKSETEMKFMDALRDIQKVCYVSATPMVGTYLSMLPEFRNLPMYYLDWQSANPSRIVKPDLKVRTMKSVRATARSIIDSYKRGNFAMRFKAIDGNRSVEVYSREAVIYVNSVNNILNIILNTGLKPEEVNILCADTQENRKKILSKLGSKYSIGKVPLLGEPHKMFTFCTRTVYLGADFYSDNARTFILSDANIKAMAVDISLDLPQILGRQRLESNPWKNSAEFYYISRDTSKSKTESQFREEISNKIKETENLLNTYFEILDKEQKATLVRVYEREAIRENYRNNYVSVNYISGYDSNGHKIIELVPKENQLAYISDLRAFDIQQKDYADRFSVFNAVDNSFLDGFKDSTEYLVQTAVNDFLKLPSTFERIRFLCDKSEDLEGTGLFGEVLNQLSDSYRCYFSQLTVEEIRACNYNASRIIDLISKRRLDDGSLKDHILERFHVGDRVSNVFVKSELKRIYEMLSYPQSPKATDLENYFIIKSGKFKNSHGKWENGFEILSLKENLINE